MRKRLGLAIAIVGLSLSPLRVAVAADLTPADGNAPVFRIFAANKGDAHIAYDNKRPLLVIQALSDVRLDRQQKGVLIVLTGADSKKLSQLTRQYKQKLLLLEGEGKILEVMHITSPVENGSLEFKYPDDEVVAEYVRKRFRLGEFKRR